MAKDDKWYGRIQHKYDTEENWKKAVHFVPLEGELIVYGKDATHDYDRFKVGDGVTLVNDLPFSDVNQTVKGNGISFGINDAINIVGGGATTVTADASTKTITISSTDTNTDTKVTAVGNHYTPSTDNNKTISKDASSTTKAAWGTTALVTGVNIMRDAAGHVTDVSLDSIQMPANPNTDTNTAHTHTNGVGLVRTGDGGTSGSVDYKAKLRNETALTIDSSAATTTSGRVYPVAIDKSGYLAVNVPWIDTNTQDGNDNQKIKTGSVTFGANDVIEFKAGSNVSISGDATNKTITVNATVPTTASVGSATGSTSYFKIHDFGAWGSGNWTSKGFSMLITSRAGETIWVTVAANDSNTSAQAIRLMDRYSKIQKIFYSVSESALYVQAAAWANNICAHILTNVYGDYVPAVSAVSVLSEDAVQIPIIPFGVSSSNTNIGSSDLVLTMAGSGDRPSYNSVALALQSDIPLIDTLIAAGSTSTKLPTSQAVAAFVEGKGYKTTDNNSYHTTGSWSGLTYTATAQGGAGALAFTIPTGTSSTTVAKGDHTHSYVPTSRTVNGKALSSNISLSASDVGAAPSSHDHDNIINGSVGIRASDSNEVSFKSNANYIYFGYENRMNSSGIVDTYKFGKHSGGGSAADGNIECGSLVAGRTLKGGTVTVGNATTLQYDSTNECLNFVFA